MSATRRKSGSDVVSLSAMLGDASELHPRCQGWRVLDMFPEMFVSHRNSPYLTLLASPRRAKKVASFTFDNVVACIREILKAARCCSIAT